MYEVPSVFFPAESGFVLPLPPPAAANAVAVSSPSFQSFCPPPPLLSAHSPIDFPQSLCCLSQDNPGFRQVAVMTAANVKMKNKIQSGGPPWRGNGLWKMTQGRAPTKVDVTLNGAELRRNGSLP